MSALPSITLTQGVLIMSILIILSDMMALQQLRIARGEAYNYALRWLNDKSNKGHEDYELVRILVSEFYHAVSSQNELYYKCIELGIVKPN